MGAVKESLERDVLNDPVNITRLLEKLYSASQSWFYETLWEIDGYKVKVEIRRNAYNFQSHGKAWIWSAQEQRWNLAASTNGSRLKCLELSYTHSEEQVRERIDSLKADTQVLLGEVVLILR